MSSCVITFPALSAGGERGHYLLCINLALAIATVADCTNDTAAQCAQATNAGNQLSALELNSVFLDDASCSTALDGCLAEFAPSFSSSCLADSCDNALSCGGCEGGGCETVSSRVNPRDAY